MTKAAGEGRKGLDRVGDRLDDILGLFISGPDGTRLVGTDDDDYVADGTEDEGNGDDDQPMDQIHGRGQDQNYTGADTLKGGGCTKRKEVVLPAKDG